LVVKEQAADGSFVVEELPPVRGDDVDELISFRQSFGFVGQRPQARVF
jgi:hypothetical protein